MRLLPHPLRRASIASLTALTLLAAPVHAAEPAPTSPEETARFERARDLYTSDQYLPAAELFEDLYATTKTPIYLYYAGLAREGAGHEAHAIQHWQQALKLGLDPEFTEKAQSRLTQANPDDHTHCHCRPRPPRPMTRHFSSPTTQASASPLP